MRCSLLVLVLAAAAIALPLLGAEGGVVVTDRLPPSSIETKRHDPPATATPWQLPKPGDPLYDADKEAEIRNNKQSHLVHVFERGVFKGYGVLKRHEVGIRGQASNLDSNVALGRKKGVPRSIRIEYPGAFYHVMARGNRREAIFHDEADRRYFLQTLCETCAMTGWRIHAWVLLNNHYHLLVETPEANLTRGMQWLQNTFTRRFNTRHRLWGRLFGDRYKAVSVEGAAGYYYETLLDYIHLNPARCRLVRPRRRQSLLDYPWSSVAQGYALPPGKRPDWLAAQDGLAAFGCADTTKGRRRFVERLNRRMVEEDLACCGHVPLSEQVDARCSHLRRGWYWGSQTFAERLLALGQSALRRKRDRGYRASLEKKAHDAKQAEELLRKGLRAARLDARKVRDLPGSDARKVEIARVIWERTIIPQSWLADHLSMGTAANVSQQLRRRRAAGSPANLPASLLGWIRSVKI